ncbi:hypothetical protein EYF80_006919 [Liparis tanakae]|uniref:Uncharacterized protein n=1 Tax=Liparis tanakae TaxID=230148 RepID=A0A4Z2J086_9TELE|nr:hypothetical protein EYF80_006919 [Liparis tanakae]
MKCCAAERKRRRALGSCSSRVALVSEALDADNDGRPAVSLRCYPVWMAHFLFSGSALLISVISCLLTQSAGSQITVVIETESAAGKDESAYDANMNAVQKVLVTLR